jgi:hypothetical protein
MELGLQVPLSDSMKVVFVVRTHISNPVVFP